MLITPMQDVEMLLDGEHFAKTEMPSSVIAAAVGSPNRLHISIPVDGKLTVLKFEVINDDGSIIMNMQRIH